MTLDSKSRKALGTDLPPGIANAVQNRLKHLRPLVSFEPLWQLYQQSNRRNPFGHRFRSKPVHKKWLFVIHAFVLCTLIGTGAWFLSPSVGAALQKSRFIELLYKSGGGFANGLEQIEQHHLSTQTDISVTHKDIRLTVAEAFYDGVQIVINYEVDFLEGKEKLTPDDAAVYYELKMEDAHPTMMSTHVFTITGDHTFVGTTLIDTSVLPEHPRLTMLVNRIGKIQGNWKVTIPLSTEKTSLLTTKFHPHISGTYHNKHFTVDEITLTPVSSQLVIKNDDLDHELAYWIKDDLETQFESGGAQGGGGEDRINFGPPSAINPKPAFITMMINGSQMAEGDYKLRDVFTDYTGTFPVVLEGNKGGTIKITNIQFLEDKTVVDYESSDAVNQLPSLMLEDSTGKKNSPSKHAVRVSRDKFAYRLEFPRLASGSVIRFGNLVDEFVKEPPKPMEVRIPLDWGNPTASQNK